VYCLIQRSETNNLIISKQLPVTKFVYLLLFLINYIDLISLQCYHFIYTHIYVYIYVYLYTYIDIYT